MIEQNQEEGPMITIDNDEKLFHKLLDVLANHEPQPTMGTVITTFVMVMAGAVNYNKQFSELVNYSFNRYCELGKERREREMQ